MAYLGQNCCLLVLSPTECLWGDRMMIIIMENQLLYHSLTADAWSNLQPYSFSFHSTSVLSFSSFFCSCRRAKSDMLSSFVGAPDSDPSAGETETVQSSIIITCSYSYYTKQAYFHFLSSAFSDSAGASPILLAASDCPPAVASSALSRYYLTTINEVSIELLLCTLMYLHSQCSSVSYLHSL